MPTLHRVTQDVRRLLKGLAVVLVVSLLSAMLLPIAKQIKEKYFPTPRPAPTVRFGKLSNLTFPKSIAEKKLRYRIETLSGTLPVFDNQAAVFKIEEAKADLLSLQRAKSQVAQIGFTAPPVTFSDTLYLWNDQSPPFRKLILDIASYRFTLSSNFYTNPDVLDAKNLPSEQEAVTIAESFLKALLTPAGLDNTKTKTSLFAIANAELVKTNTFSDAHIVRVDFFQKEVNKLAIYYAGHPHSQLFFLIGSGARNSHVVQANFPYNKIASTSSTYPIISADEAFARLKEKQAYITSYNGTSDEVVIRNVTLGYYMGEGKQEFLMPVIVFEGDDDFFALVSSVTDSWTRK